MAGITGTYPCGDLVTTNLTLQLSPGQRTSMVRDATIFIGQGTRTQFASSADYTSYKKAQALAASKASTVLPAQSSIVTTLQSICNPPA
jgi:hypothetical protein